MSIIGDNLRKIRNEKSISQIELSRMSGVSNTYINRIEKNVLKNPSLDTLQKLATALHCSVDDLTNKYNQNEIKDKSISDVVNELIENKKCNSNEATVAGLILERMRNENLIDENFTLTPKLKSLLEEAIQLDAKLNNNLKKGAK